MKRSLRDYLSYIIKHNIIIQKVYRTVIGNCIRLLGGFVKSEETLVLLCSYGGKKFNDSPKVLYEAMRKDDRFSNLRYVWAFEEEQCSEEVQRYVRIDSLEYFLVALKAKVWITNVNIERGLRFKKDSTVYLNTWHGTGPKKGGNAVRSRNDYDFSNVDILCVDGEYSKRVFKKYWNAKEESMLMCGRPREDELFSFTLKEKEKIKGKLKIKNNKKVILYMPTWRDYNFRILDFNKWRSVLQEEYIVLIRTHHFSKYNLENVGNFIIDVSEYENVNELYWISDILITDYSSAMFDFGLLGKPLLCYADDYDIYKEKNGLFMDLREEFPNGVIEDETELIKKILTMNYEEEKKKSKLFVSSYVKHDKNATKCCLDALYDMLNLRDGDRCSES